MAITLSTLRAEIEAAKKLANAKFAADWHGLTPREACKVVSANDHLFKPFP